MKIQGLVIICIIKNHIELGWIDGLASCHTVGDDSIYPLALLSVFL